MESHYLAGARHAFPEREEEEEPAAGQAGGELQPGQTDLGSAVRPVLGSGLPTPSLMSDLVLRTPCWKYCSAALTNPVLLLRAEQTVIN